ncbi:MAG: hypothetical protein ACFCA4_09095 [Cyanophyceae cyanobacterium]
MLFSKSYFSRFLAISLLSGSLMLAGCSSDSSAQSADPSPTPESSPELAASPTSSPPAEDAQASSPSPEPVVEAAPAAPNTGPVAVASIPSSVEIRVEGTPVQVSLEAYRPEGLPIAMGLPEESFIPRVIQTPQWTEVRLVSSYQGAISSEKVYVSIIWPKESISLDKAQNMLFEETRKQEIGLQGVVSTGNETIYAWERRRWRFEKNITDGPGGIFGRAFVGELKGQPFWVVTHTLAEFAEGYGPRFNIILDTLQ